MTDENPHHFVFDLDRGIRDQLLEKLRISPKLRLEARVGPRESGLYAIHYQGELVYIGKATKSFTKSARTLRDRLGEHRRKLSARAGGALSEIEIQYLTFESDWWVVAGEVALIRHLDPPWNDSGFGSKTPGAGRPGTDRISKFDLAFPEDDMSEVDQD